MSKYPCAILFLSPKTWCQGISGRRVRNCPSVILSIFLKPSPIAMMVMQLPARACVPLGDKSKAFMSVMP